MWEIQSLNKLDPGNLSIVSDNVFLARFYPFEEKLNVYMINCSNNCRAYNFSSWDFLEDCGRVQLKTDHDAKEE